MKRIILSLLLLSVSILSFAQKNEEKKIQEMVEDKTSYIIERMGLTPEETEKFVPIYKKYTTERINTFESSPFENFNYKEEKSMSEEEFKKINAAYVNGKVNRALTTKLYYEKFREVIPESKIYKMQMAERDFKHELLKRVQNKGCQHKATTTNKK